MALGSDPDHTSAGDISAWVARRFSTPAGFHIAHARPAVTDRRELVLAITIAPDNVALGRFNLSQAEELRGELGAKENGRRLKRTKRACAARGKALAKGGSRVSRSVSASRLARLCPALGVRRKANDAHRVPAPGETVAILKVYGMPYGVESYFRSGLYRSGEVITGRPLAIGQHTLLPVRLRDQSVVYVPTSALRTLTEMSETNRMTFGVLSERIEEHLRNGGSVSYVNDRVLFSEPKQAARKRNAGFGWSTSIVKGKKVIVAENGKPLLRYVVVDGRGKKLAPIYATTDGHAQKQLAKRTPKARLVSKAHLLATSSHGKALLRQGGKATPRKATAR